MAGTPSQESVFEKEAIMIGALAVPLPKLDPSPPEEREQRLEAIIANLDKYDKDVRENIVRLSNAAIKNDAGAGAGAEQEVGRDDYEELFASLRAGHDPRAGDIYAFNPSSATDQAESKGKKHDPRIETLLSEYDAHAQVRNQKYRDSLKRQQESYSRPSPVQRSNSMSGSNTTIHRSRDPRSRD